MGAKNKIEQLIDELRYLGKDLVKLDHELGNQKSEDERKVTTTKGIEVKLFVASIKYERMVERIFRLTNNGTKSKDQFAGASGVRDSAEDNLEDA